MFKPWIGTAWAKPDNAIGGLRLLVLGESHYHDNPSLTGKFEENATTDTILTYAINGSTRFFNGIAHVISGKHRSECLCRTLRIFGRVSYSITMCLHT